MTMKGGERGEEEEEEEGAEEVTVISGQTKVTR